MDQNLEQTIREIARTQAALSPEQAALSLESLAQDRDKLLTVIELQGNIVQLLNERIDQLRLEFEALKTVLDLQDEGGHA